MSSSIRMTIECSLRSDAWALRKISTYCDGKLLIWAWVSRGLVSIEWIAGLYFNNDVDAANEALGRVKSKLAELCMFDELPILDSAEYKERNNEATQMVGEVNTFWAISDPDVESDPIPLPPWMRASIDKAILQWRDLLTKWEKRIEDRQKQGKLTLPAKTQKKYDEFMDSKTRSLVFDKTKQAEVVNIAAKSINQLKKHCLLLVVHLSEKPEDLKLATGCGKLWLLKLLQHTVPISDDVPVEVDHFQGQHGQFQI